MISDTDKYKQSRILELKKLDIIQGIGGSANNTGDTKVQIAIQSLNVARISKHLIQSRNKDLHSLRGLRGALNKRNSLLKYLRETSPKEAIEITEKLGISNK